MEKKEEDRTYTAQEILKREEAECNLREVKDFPLVASDTELKLEALVIACKKNRILAKQAYNEAIHQIKLLIGNII